MKRIELHPLAIVALALLMVAMGYVVGHMTGVTVEGAHQAKFRDDLYITRVECSQIVGRAFDRALELDRMRENPPWKTPTPDLEPQSDTPPPAVEGFVRAARRVPTPTPTPNPMCGEEVERAYARGWLAGVAFVSEQKTHRQRDAGKS